MPSYNATVKLGREKKENTHLYVTSVIKQFGRSIRLYVTVVAVKLLLGNFGYKAV